MTPTECRRTSASSNEPASGNELRINRTGAALSGRSPQACQVDLGYDRQSVGRLHLRIDARCESGALALIEHRRRAACQLQILEVAPGDHEPFLEARLLERTEHGVIEINAPGAW